MESWSAPATSMKVPLCEKVSPRGEVSRSATEKFLAYKADVTLNGSLRAYW